MAVRPRFIILVGAKCETCDPHGLGAKTGNYFGKVYDLARWKRRPKCVNCRTRMTKLWETKVPLEYTNDS